MFIFIVPLSLATDPFVCDLKLLNLCESHFQCVTPQGYAIVATGVAYIAVEMSFLFVTVSLLEFATVVDYGALQCQSWELDERLRNGACQ